MKFRKIVAEEVSYLNDHSLLRISSTDSEGKEATIRRGHLVSSKSFLINATAPVCKRTCVDTQVLPRCTQGRMSLSDQLCVRERGNSHIAIAVVLLDCVGMQYYFKKQLVLIKPEFNCSLLISSSIYVDLNTCFGIKHFVIPYLRNLSKYESSIYRIFAPKDWGVD